jgi:hypothetical protein
MRQVYDLADRMPDDRYGFLVLLAAFAGLLWGEVSALRRRGIDTDAGTVTAPPARRARHRHPGGQPAQIQGGRSRDRDPGRDSSGNPRSPRRAHPT